MTNRKIFRNNRAVAGVIEALLMVALVSTVIGMIQVIYIPEVMKQREADHMDEVSNQFSYMKAMIDIQSTTGSNVPIFSILTLGSRELPYFATVPSFGSLNVFDNNNYPIKINFGGPLNPPAYLTSIAYEADNNYFVPQTYALEGGGIIVDQPGGESVMRVDPSITVTNGTSIITVNFDLPVYVSIPEKNQTNGLGKCIIRTNYSRSESQTTPSISSIEIYTKYVNAWNDSLSTIFGATGTVTKGANYVQVTPIQYPPGPQKTFTLVLKRNYITVQIGPGWVI